MEFKKYKPDDAFGRHIQFEHSVTGSTFAAACQVAIRLAADLYDKELAVNFVAQGVDVQVVRSDDVGVQLDKWQRCLAAKSRGLGNKKQTDAEALAQYSEYMNSKAPQVIYPAPAELAEHGKIVVAPEENSSWFMGSFRDLDSARDYCNRNGLSFTEHDAQPVAA